MTPDTTDLSQFFSSTEFQVVVTLIDVRVAEVKQALTVEADHASMLRLQGEHRALMALRDRLTAKPKRQARPVQDGGYTA